MVLALVYQIAVRAAVFVVCGLRFRVGGSGSWVWGFKCGRGIEFRVQSLGRVWALGSGFRVLGLGFRV
jgi:hypothetical protein